MCVYAGFEPEMNKPFVVSCGPPTWALNVMSTDLLSPIEELIDCESRVAPLKRKDHKVIIRRVTALIAHGNRNVFFPEHHHKASCSNRPR